MHEYHNILFAIFYVLRVACTVLHSYNSLIYSVLFVNV
jgi:hypothetical protein